MRLKKKYRNLLRFIAVTLILILMISVVAAAKQHIDNKKSNHNQDIEEEYPDEDAEAYELSHMMEFQEQYRAGVIR